MATLEELAADKERELQQLRECAALRNKENVKNIQSELAQEKGRLVQLRADFDYNLSLLTQRDEELLRYEETFAGVRQAINTLLADNSQLKAQLADRESQLALAQEREGEVRRQCSQRVSEVQSRAEAVRALHTATLDKERQVLRESRRELELKMTDLEGDLASQRDEITSHFEQILRERDSENELRMTDLRSALAASENKYRETVRELESCRAAILSLKDETKSKTEAIVKAEKKIRERQWALEDRESEQEGRVRELERRLANNETKLNRQADEFVKRHSEMDRRLREKESVLKSARDAHNVKVTSLEASITNLTRELETRDSALSTVQEQYEETLSQKQSELERCHNAVEVCRRECSEKIKVCRREAVERVEGAASEVVKRDLQLQVRQDQLELLRTREEQLRKELDRCKEELGSIIATNQEHTQDIQQLTAARDKLVTECRLLREKFSKEPPSHVTNDDVISKLQQQNSDLHNVIRQMREELEALTEQEPANQISASYVHYMERELAEMKSKNRELEVKIQSKAVSTAKPPPSPAPSEREVTQGTQETHRGHVLALSETIGCLQTDKRELETQLSLSKRREEQLESLCQQYKEKIYLLKSCRVPQSQVHQKLVHATQVIIALLKDKRQSQEVKGQSQENKVEPQDIVVQPREVKVQTTPIQMTDIHTQTEAVRLCQPIVQSKQSTYEMSSASKESSLHARDFPLLVSEGEFPPLRFTDSSLGSLGSVLDMVEKELSDSPRGSSTPNKPHPPDDNYPKLELVGHRAKENVRPGPKLKVQQPKLPVKKNKRLVRNYNIKDD